MEKMKMQTKNIVDENIDFIGKKFPNCIVESKDDNGKITRMVDFDLLKQELSNTVVDGDKERYVMTWPDKKQAILTANAPISKTLCPCRDKSKDFDSTKNIYIEGDNLDVLKILRETYLGKVKMIYIDPPYNTGSDFIYNDDFSKSVEDFLQNSNQVDENGNRMVINSDASGRFHTDWLNMIYPRLKVAKDFLREDGVIFISIDDNELSNLMKICDEIYGEMNFVANLVWKSKSGGANDVSGIATDSENILVYAKNISKLKMFLDTEAEVTTAYNQIDEKGKRYSLDRLDKQSLGYHESLDFPIIGPDGKTYVVEHKNPNNKVARWRWSAETVKERYSELVFKYPYVYTKNYEKDGIIPRNLLIDERFGRSRTGKTEVASLFENIAYFDFPKPTKLIAFLTKIAAEKDDIVLDFFSGSATTAHAVMQINAEKYCNIKFILVQLPEKTSEKLKAFVDGYKTICDIGEERIRRAGERLIEQVEINQDAENKRKRKLDIGFRVFRLETSNMKDTYYKPGDYSQSLLDQLDENIKPDRTPEDLVFQVMLDLGLMLDSRIEEKDINGKKVYIVGEYNDMIKPDLICCFDSKVDNDTVTQIAKMKPRYAVFRDSSMAKDSVAINFDQIFETYSPTTTRRAL